MKSFIRRIFWFIIIIAYVVGWYYLDQNGIVEWFADTFVQPFVGERDAYFGVTAMMLVALVGLGPGVALGEVKR